MEDRWQSQAEVARWLQVTRKWSSGYETNSKQVILSTERSAKVATEPRHLHRIDTWHGVHEDIGLVMACDEIFWARRCPSPVVQDNKIHCEVILLKYLIRAFDDNSSERDIESSIGEDPSNKPAEMPEKKIRDLLHCPFLFQPDRQEVDVKFVYQFATPDIGTLQPARDLVSETAAVGLHPTEKTSGGYH
ncbi:hypothetical protein TNCV_2281541 [Trichonephila clavipes]|nr:hypothetical protein TNCV_2281541 [Trichonephila clavipes]